MKRFSFWVPVVRLGAAICALVGSLGVWNSAVLAESPHALRVLFLGDEGHHKPADRFKQLQPVLAKHAIDLDYSASLDDLSPGKLAGYDCVMIYANWTQISPNQEKALVDFVEHGGGFVPLHCASFCFLNSPKYIELVGAQFQKHGTGVFKETIVNPDHPVMKGLEPIESWDESYVHTKHNPDRTVLAERRDEKGAEPYTWVREVGQGRVFYTAWGHDERTWSNAGFQTLVENGVRWASAHSFTRLAVHTGTKPFEYMDAPGPLPNYTPGAQWGTQSEPIKTMQKPLDPAESQTHLAVFPGFQTSLFAADPDIVKPIWLSWDERGRLWIAETIDYPNNMQPDGQGHDRLTICEDSDGDGKADKFTIFADKLSVPTGFVIANGGVIVIHSGKAEFFKDNDGDDKADERRVLFTGWGTSDTHAAASNLHYGFDNWIWGTVGYSGFEGTVGGKKIRFGQGIYRFKADGSALEFVRSSNNNTWGLGISEDNIIFGSTANGNASMYMPMANRYYEAVNGWSAARLETIADSQRFYPLTDKVRQVDYHGKYTAGAGSALYTARAFPQEYWNRVQFVAEPTGHLLGKFHIEARGADFVAHNGRNFLASDDEWTAPVCAEVGPDGALWVSDWYNYIIQHNPTPRGFGNGKGNAYETPLRDKTHGRIYRVSYKEGKTPAPPRLDKATPGQWVAALGNDNLLWRMHAQRLLVTRGQRDVVPLLCALVGNQSVDGIGLNAAALHALWTLQGLGVLDGFDATATQAAISALKHPSAAVRRAALMVLPRDEASLKAILASNGTEDSDAQVRLAALLALSELPASPDSARAVFASLNAKQNAKDRWIPDAATAAAARNDAGFLQVVLASYKPATSSTKEAAPANVLTNPSFEVQADGQATGWHPVTHSGRGDFGMGDSGHTGSKSAKISSENGADVSWTATVSVKPRTDYKLTGWIKTQGVSKRGGAKGALFNIHELQDPVNGATKGLAGDNDWTQVQLNFNSGEMTEVTVNCLFGGWGQATGTAWFDDVELVPAPGSELAGETGRVLRVVTAHYAQRGPLDTIVATLTSLKGASPGVATAVLDGLVSGWPEDKTPTLSETDKSTLTGLMNSMAESSRDRLLALAQKWGQPEIFGANFAAIIGGLKKQISDSNAADDLRAAAAKRLMTLEARLANAELIVGQIGLLTPPALGTGLLGALTDSRDRDTGKAVVNGWQQYTPTLRRTAIGVLMRRPDWTRTLLDAIEKGTIARTDLATEQWSQLKQNPNRELGGRATRLSSTGPAISADREEIVKKLLPLAKEHGNPTRGKEVFTANCSACHTFNGQGGKVGPDLSGIGAKDRSEILTDILDPNRSVEANYRLWSLTTKDGETFSGRLDTETQTSVEILDTTGQKHAIQRSKIATLESSQNSIMPNGFESIPADDIKGLLDYLGQAHL